MFNPYAIYVRCDGAMNYDSENSGGIGYRIEFPDSVNINPIEVSKGIYVGSSIERLELEALIEAMLDTIKAVDKNIVKLRGCPVRIVTDRFSLQDDNRTNAYAIREWRRNGWKNHEGKPIKNKDLLDKLDKTRKKLTDLIGNKVEIEWKRRKYNKKADKLAKAGKKEGLKTDKIAKKGEKIGSRKFNGHEIIYKTVKEKEYFTVNVFRKDPVQEQWEVWVEICKGRKIGQKMKIYADNSLAFKPKRGNQFEVKVKQVFRYHLSIYRTLRKISKRSLQEEDKA